MINKRKRKKKEKCFEKELLKAKKGDPNAMYWIAHHCDEDEDENMKALVTRCLGALVKLGDNGTTAITLAEHYEYGIGVPQNGQKAIELYTNCYYKEMGQECIGYMYYAGSGVPKDYDKAWQHFEKGSGYSCSTFYAKGDMYLHGWGVEQDLKKAEEYFQLIIDCNSRWTVKDDYLEPAMFQMARLIIDRQDAQELACKYVDKVAEKYSNEEGTRFLRELIKEDELQELVDKVNCIKVNYTKFVEHKINRVLIHSPINDHYFKWIRGNCLGLSDYFDQHLYIDYTAMPDNKIDSIEVICQNQEEKIYCVDIIRLEKEDGEESKKKQYYKLYRMITGNKDGDQTIDDVLHKIFYKKKMDLSHWQDITQEQTGQEYVNKNVLWIKHYGYCDWVQEEAAKEA